jgi:hypothetical protein
MRRITLIRSFASATALAATLSCVGIVEPVGAVLPPITCEVNVQYAHGSIHFAGTINVVSTVECNLPVASINQTTLLHKSGGGVWQGSPVVRTGVATAQSNAAVSCSQGPGIFFGSAHSFMVAPPNYLPPTLTDDRAGKSLSVVCGSAARVAMDSALSSETETYTVTFEPKSP